METSQEIYRIRVKALRSKSPSAFWNKLTELQQAEAKTYTDPRTKKFESTPFTKTLDQIKTEAWNYFKDIKNQEESSHG